MSVFGFFWRVGSLYIREGLESSHFTKAFLVICFWKTHGKPFQTMMTNPNILPGQPSGNGEAEAPGEAPGEFGVGGSFVVVMFGLLSVVFETCSERNG